jgi:hypothetical protein
MGPVPDGLFKKPDWKEQRDKSTLGLSPANREVWDPFLGRGSVLTCSTCKENKTMLRKSMVMAKVKGGAPKLQARVIPVQPYRGMYFTTLTHVTLITIPQGRQSHDPHFKLGKLRKRDLMAFPKSCTRR